jgi:lipopolysaccharide/colanic/teichoic acid biosynthesis glycosyltransferase
VRNASLWIDLKIIAKTMLFMISGETWYAEKAGKSTAIVTHIQPAE